VKRLAVIAALAFVAAACGGGGTSLYTRAPSSACLQKQGVRVGPVSDTADFVAASATGGAFRAHLVQNDVTVSFGETQVDADNIDQAYRRFHAKNVGIDDILRRQGNAVMLWRTHPQDADIATITNCLKS
jgi:hypothetical protein